MTTLMDDTQRLLAVDIPELESTLAESLEQLSLAVVLQVALQAKTDAYELRVTRCLARAANLGACLTELADAAGMDRAHVIARLQTRRDLLDPAAESRLLTERDADPSCSAGSRRQGLFGWLGRGAFRR